MDLIFRVLGFRRWDLGLHCVDSGFGNKPLIRDWGFYFVIYVFEFWGFLDFGVICRVLSIDFAMSDMGECKVWFFKE